MLLEIRTPLEYWIKITPSIIMIFRKEKHSDLKKTDANYLRDLV